MWVDARALSVTKSLGGFSTAHRLHTADSHCRFIHGYERTVELTVTAEELDDNGWVIDFAAFKDYREMLAQQFDHKLVVSNSDPELGVMMTLDQLGICSLVTMDHPGIEGMVDWVVTNIGPAIIGDTDGRCWLTAVTCRENAKNAVTWRLL